MPLCPKHRAGNSLENFKIKRKVGVGCRHESCFPTSSSLWGCALCKIPMGRYWTSQLSLGWTERLLAFSAWGRGPRRPGLHKNSPSSNINCAFVRKHWKSPIPQAKELFTVTSTQWTAKWAAYGRLFLLPRAPFPTWISVQLLKPHWNIT